MINPFLLHIGYDEFEIATAGKFFGITATIIGGLIASYIMKYFNIFKSLIFFGVLHGAGHMLFIVQEIYGENIYLLFFKFSWVTQNFWSKFSVTKPLFKIRGSH